jgi:outer membrane immunogenic protein
VLLNRACTLLIAACVGTCVTQAALAFDLNSVTPPLAKPQQKPDWAGFYFKGSSAGSSDGIPWATLAPGQNSLAPTALAPTPAPANSNFGYNIQSGNLVFGLEGSLAAANFDGRFTAPYMPGLAAGAWTPNMNWMGTVTGKLGYAFGQWLPYVKGGFATADVGSPLQGASSLGAFSQGTEATGWTAGVGFEYQFSPKWSLGVEYLYTDLGGNSNGAPGSLSGAPLSNGAPEMYSTALKSQSLLGRLNYKAGW